MNNEYKLTEGIIALSVSDTWSDAKFEWQVYKINIVDNPHTCLCSHYPIKELCYLKNTANNKRTLVGNCCVKKFMGLRPDLIIDAFERVMEDPYKPLNDEAIDFARDSNWITLKQVVFLRDTKHKRNLSSKQFDYRKNLNDKVINAWANSHDN